MSQVGYELDVTLTGHTGTVTTLQFSPDCKFLASGSNHGVLLIFSTSSWRPLKRLVDVSPITTIVWHDTERYLLLCGCESGDLHFVNLTKSLETTIDSTSYFEGPIRSLSLSLATSALAVGYGENVSLVGIRFNPYALNDDQKLLPKPPSRSQQPAGRASELVAMSLHFLERKNQLIVTYLNYDIVRWDLSTMSIVRRIASSACLMGRSVLSQDCSTMAASNLLDGVDWYSLSSSKLISSSKIPISTSPSDSSLTYVDGGNAIVIGGLAGQAYIVDCQTFDVRQELDHNDRRDIESVAFSPSSGGKRLIATGAVESEGTAPINVWVSTLGGRNRTTSPKATSVDAARLSWSGVLTYSALLFLCYTWVTHLLTAG